ncbi:hypothetical protein OIY81_2172 [Cryptosporidium canis]|nr:hypothetical protein OIY81_2172 [Cryptosporidium canis]
MISSYYRIIFTILIPITLIVTYSDIVTRGSSLVSYVAEYSLVKLRYPTNRRNNKGCCCSCTDDDEEDNVDLNTRVNPRNNDCQPLRSCLKNGPSRNLNVRFTEVDGGHPGDTNHPMQRPRSRRVSNDQLIDGRDPHPRKNSIENPPSTYPPQGFTYLDEEEEEEEEDGCSSSCFCSCKRKKKKPSINPYANYDGERSTIFHPQASEDSNIQEDIPEPPSIPPPPFYPPPPLFPPPPPTAAPSLPPARSPSPPFTRSQSLDIVGTRPSTPLPRSKSLDLAGTPPSTPLHRTKSLDFVGAPPTPPLPRTKSLDFAGAPPTPPLSRSASFRPGDAPPSPQMLHSPPTPPPLPLELIYKPITSKDTNPTPIPPRATKKRPIRHPNQPENSFSPEDIVSGFLSLRNTGSRLLPHNSIITNRKGKGPCDDDLNSPEDTDQNTPGASKPSEKDPVVPAPQRPAASTLQRPIGPSIPKHAGPTLPRPKESSKPKIRIPRKLSNAFKPKKDPNSRVSRLADQLHDAISQTLTNPLPQGISLTALIKQRSQGSSNIPPPPAPEVQVPHSHGESVYASEAGASGGNNQGQDLLRRGSEREGVSRKSSKLRPSSLSSHLPPPPPPPLPPAL